MLGKFTITVRLYLNAAISIGLIGVVGFVGYQGILHLTEANQTSATYAKAIRYQVEVDMFHDGIASVVNAALISGLRFDRPMYESARAGLEEHAKAMQDDISTVAGLPLDPEVKAKLEATRDPLVRYIAGARRIVEQAYEHSDEAFSLKSEFDALFDRLEIDLEALGDAMLSRTEAAEQAASEAAAYRETMMIVSLGIAIPLLLLAAMNSAVSIGSRIDGLKRFTADLAQGDADLTKRLPESGADEVTDTAREFNRFMSTLEDLVGSAKAAARSVASTATELDRTAQDLSLGSASQSDAAGQPSASGPPPCALRHTNRYIQAQRGKRRYIDSEWEYRWQRSKRRSPIVEQFYCAVQLF